MDKKNGFTAGAWVAGKDYPEMPMLGRVREVHDTGELDIVIYSKTGEKLGRVSPPMGGPTGFEPFCSPDLWDVIEKPDFATMGKMICHGEAVVRVIG